MDQWRQLLATLPEDPDQLRLQQQAVTPAPQPSPMIDPMLLEYLARKAGYRGEFGAHPDIIKGAPGLSLRFVDDTPIKR